VRRTAHVQGGAQAAVAFGEGEMLDQRVGDERVVGQVRDGLRPGAGRAASVVVVRRSASVEGRAGCSR
jgi:hypothetical protein